MHCTAGKDRTGVLAALMLLLVGVDEETIVSEYSLTEVGLASWKAHLIAYISKETDNNDLDEDQKGSLNMLGAKKESMRESLKMLKREYGTAEDYMKKVCGFTEDDLTRIRKNLTSQVDAVL
jgi:protein tyrosine/serine phosphatase